jgi:Flp pilus assembly protein TadD
MALAVGLALGLSTGPVPGLAAGTYDPEPTAEERRLSPLDRGRALIGAEEYARAIEALEEARAAEPDDPDVHNYLGYAARKLGDLPAAEAHYTRALDLDPAHRGALAYMGELYLTLERPERARALLDRLDAACPQGCPERDALQTALDGYAASR